MVVILHTSPRQLVPAVAVSDICLPMEVREEEEADMFPVLDTARFIMDTVAMEAVDIMLAMGDTSRAAVARQDLGWRKMMMWAGDPGNPTNGGSCGAPSRPTTGHRNPEAYDASAQAVALTIVAISTRESSKSPEKPVPGTGS